MNIFFQRTKGQIRIKNKNKVCSNGTSRDETYMRFLFSSPGIVKFLYVFRVESS